MGRHPHRAGEVGNPEMPRFSAPSLAPETSHPSLPWALSLHMRPPWTRNWLVPRLCSLSAEWLPGDRHLGSQGCALHGSERERGEGLGVHVSWEGPGEQVVESVGGAPIPNPRAGQLSRSPSDGAGVAEVCAGLSALPWGPALLPRFLLPLLLSWALLVGFLYQRDFVGSHRLV